MYNTEFIVKYNDIKEELIFKLKNKTEKEYIDNPEPEYEYSTQDILDICHKLYIDELCSVFYTQDIFDDQIDKGMKYVLEKMLFNTDFKTLIHKIKNSINFNEFCDYSIITDQTATNLDENIDLMVLLTLFSEPIFYITHKCVCQQIDTGIINNELIQELNEHTITAFTL